MFPGKPISCISCQTLTDIGFETAAPVYKNHERTKPLENLSSSLSYRLTVHVLIQPALPAPIRLAVEPFSCTPCPTTPPTPLGKIRIEKTNRNILFSRPSSAVLCRRCRRGPSPTPPCTSTSVRKTAKQSTYRVAKKEYLKIHGNAKQCPRRCDGKEKRARINASLLMMNDYRKDNNKNVTVEDVQPDAKCKKIKTPAPSWCISRTIPVLSLV